jgi:lipid A ethanolaminephosphotransferase
MKSKTMPSLWSGLDRKIDISPSSLVWIFALANAAVFHGPLIGYVNSNLELTSSLGVGAVMVLLGISLLLMWLLLGGADLASSRFLKPLMVLVTLCNALALYAMETYQVILDKAMMGNVMNTNADESLALFHPRLLIYLLLAGLFCLILFRFFRLKNKTRLNRLGHFVIAVLISLGLIFVNSSSWLWVDKHAKMIGGLLLPWSYTVNTARYLNDQKLASRKLDQLPELIWAADAGLPVTVVLVIGESARAQNFSLLGYERQTNPRLEKRNLLLMKSAQSCSTYTTRSLECMLSHEPRASGLTHEILPNYLHRSGQVQVLWRARNWGEPQLNFDSVLRGKRLSDLCVAPDCLHANQDETLLAGLESEIQQTKFNKQLIVLHQSGSHGPAYNQKYPADFSRFEPVCDTVDLKKCTPQALINAYDNSILYTDHLLDQLIALLERQTQRRTVMIYISDHGESLGEGGWYLHGAPEILAPKEQKNIPFFVWASPSFSRESGFNPIRAQTNTETIVATGSVNGHHQIFHSVLGALGGKSSAYRADLDIFQTSNAKVSD